METSGILCNSKTSYHEKLMKQRSSMGNTLQCTLFSFFLTFQVHSKQKKIVRLKQKQSRLNKRKNNRISMETIITKKELFASNLENNNISCVALFSLCVEYLRINLIKISIFH